MAERLSVCNPNWAGKQPAFLCRGHGLLMSYRSVGKSNQPIFFNFFFNTGIVQLQVLTWCRCIRRNGELKNKTKEQI